MGHDVSAFMGWGMVSVGLLLIFVAVLAAAALLKYLFSKGS